MELSSILKVFKVTSLQYHCIISKKKKKVTDGIHFLHADKQQTFYKLAVWQYPFLHLEHILPSSKLCNTNEEKIFSTTIIFFGKKSF